MSPSSTGPPKGLLLVGHSVHYSNKFPSIDWDISKPLLKASQPMMVPSPLLSLQWGTHGGGLPQE
jgi:hypothetical protein